MAGIWSYHERGGWPDVHWVLVLAQNTGVGTDAQGCQVLLLVPRIKAGVDGRGCVTMSCDRSVWQDSELVRVCRRVHDRTWNQVLSGCVTRLGTGQSLSSGSEFESRRSEFEQPKIGVWIPKIGSCQHWFRVFVSVGHKGVTGRNMTPPTIGSC